MNIRKALVWLSFSFSLLLAAPAFAQNAKVEAAAKALQKKAMDEDYLATEFTKGQDKLEKALAQCGADKCSAGLRAQLRRDLGVVQIGGQLDKEKGIGNLVEALKLDPAIALDPDLRTKDLDASFNEAKKRAGGGGGGGKTAPATSSGGQPTGDFVHEPTEIQQIRTPIPVYAEYSGEETLVKVIARYKGFGMTDWKAVELKKTGEKGWSVLLPCADVQQGTTQYYLQGFNAANDPVAVGGDRNNPYKTRVTREPVAEPPHLPGQAAPTQCADTGDCPPNFPGCKKGGASATVGPEQLTGKDGGEFCEEDSECKSKECSNSKCTEPPTSSGPYKKLWVGLAVGLDVHFLPSANDVCKLNPSNGANPLTPTNDSNYYCVQSDGADYPYRPVSAADAANGRGPENTNLVPGQSDKVSGGTAIGNIRIMLSADYAVTSSILVGARLGLALNTYPGQAASDDGKKFPPLHAEVRGTFLLKKDALMQSWAPYVMVAAGLATFDASVKVNVVERPGGVPTGSPAVAKNVDAWHIAGPGFFSTGGGVRVAIGQRAAFMGGLRLNLAIGNATAFSVGPEVGMQIGF
ncbi:MAG: hypothetical protein JWP97_2132 [Labilithrix sp.]|nr:hypothetical protein [Labilithrix sp.]